MFTMESLPSGLPSITDAEFDRLKASNPGMWLHPYNGGCITCADTKRAKVRQDGKVTEIDCDCIAQWRLYVTLLHAGIDRNYQAMSWDDIDDQIPAAVQEKVYEYAEMAADYVPAGLGLIFYGKNGTGKTLLATLLLKRLIGMGYRGLFIQFNELLDENTAGWRDEEQRQWFIRRVRNAQVLVIDDVGKESKGRSNVTDSIFDQVIRHRTAANAPTFITTNLTIAEMRILYGESLAGLFEETCEYIEVPGLSYRAKMRQRKVDDTKAGIKRPVVLA